VSEVERGKPSVLALGGGTFVRPDNFALLENNGVTLWLDAPFELIKQRVAADGSRPLATDPVMFRELFEARRNLYQLADHRVVIQSEDPDANVDAIIALKLFGA